MRIASDKHTPVSFQLTLPLTAHLERKTQITVWYVIVALLGVIWLRDLWMASRQVEPLPYGDFQALLQQGKIEELAIRDNTMWWQASRNAIACSIRTSAKSSRITKWDMP